MEKGIYEQVISQSLQKKLDGMDAGRIHAQEMDTAESAQILASYVQEILQSRLKKLDSKAEQIELVNSLLRPLEDGEDDRVMEPGSQLLTVLDEKDPFLAAGRKAADFPRPETSVSRSSLFTGSAYEPSVYTEFKKEIASSDSIDMLVSFIRWSGLRLILDELKEFAGRGGKLRVITTSYMGATEVRAVEELSALPGAEVKISYDSERTRLHAKAYIYHRNTGYSTAYVGSSNLTNPAISSGLEWNTKLSRQDQPEMMDKIHATFASYWNSEDFSLYDSSRQERLKSALSQAHGSGSEEERPAYLMDVRPYPYQQEILDRLEADRTVRGNFRNLVVAATGTGKTVISALDYRNYVQKHPGRPNRLLFIAHREEILKQSLQTFREVLKDPNFGDLFVGNFHPEQVDHLFMSIQTFNSQNFLAKIAADFYDFVIVDEFHHSAAPSYRKMIACLQPDILLGLTATPERMDGKNVAEMFGGRISAEIRLPEAVDRKLLVPFQYFGVSDTVDLSHLKWANGSYDKTALEEVYVGNRKRAAHVVSSVEKYCRDIVSIKGLGFCTTVKHAQFMASYFNEAGIPSMMLSGKSSEEERSSAKGRLVSGEIKFIFVVDLYNEGVDIPEVNTILFLRPTESLTVFLQQLGRGLRLAPDKECLTVLDFIGASNRRYDFESKFQALLSRSGRVAREIKTGFPNVPKGCFVQLERKASEYVLDNIRQSISSRKGIMQRMETFEEDTGLPLRVDTFLEHYQLDPRLLYKYGSFYELAEKSGQVPEYKDQIDIKLSRQLGRLTSANSSKWISFIKQFEKDLDSDKPESYSGEERLMMDMLFQTMFLKSSEGFKTPESRKRLEQMKNSRPWRRELSELMDYQFNQIDCVDIPYEKGNPLEVHASYSRDQLLAAFGYENPSNVREGVKWLKDVNTDIFMITLNKAEKDYSPTTLYQDYSINDRLFHWQSQSTTSESSSTGQRYIHHKEQGGKILLFVREFKKDPVSGTAPAYTFLGPAEYVSHEGSSPMNIVWKLKHPIPAKYLKTTSKLLN